MHIFVGGGYLITSQVHQGEALQRAPQPSLGALCANPAPTLRVMAHVRLGTCIFQGPSVQQPSPCCARSQRGETGTPSPQPRFHPSPRVACKKGSHLPSAPTVSVCSLAQGLQLSLVTSSRSNHSAPCAGPLGKSRGACQTRSPSSSHRPPISSAIRLNQIFWVFLLQN